jgi:putative phosphoesterase
MRIAVIADTHGRLPESVANAIRTADEIWHLGDFPDPTMVAAIRGLGPTFHGVLGNCDCGIDLPMELLLERAGRTFRLIHIPPAKLTGADFLLHGHTHVPRDEKIGATRVLNPGTVSKPNHGSPPSFAWMEIDDAGTVSWRVVPVLR